MGDTIGLQNRRYLPKVLVMMRVRHFALVVLASIASLVLVGALLPSSAAAQLTQADPLDLDLEPGMHLAGDQLLVDPGDVADVALVTALAEAELLDTYVSEASGAPGAAMVRMIGSPRGYEALRATVIAEAKRQIRTVDAVHTLEDRSEELRVDLRDVLVTDPSSDEVHWIEAELNDAADELEKLRKQQARNADSLRGQFGELHALRRGGTVAVDGLAMVVFDAYLRAEASAAQRTNPDCRFSWTLFAGIGRIESKHGTINGASVDRAGDTRPRILGPLLDGGATERTVDEEEAALAAAEAEALAEVEAEIAAEEEARDRVLWGLYLDLPEDDEDESVADGDQGDDSDDDGADDDDSDRDDGEDGDDADEGEEAEDEEEGNGFAVIVDTDDGALDGNADWDRAVGPMQFIPETWGRSATDGNGDGNSDPHNMYDAVASASTLLCKLVDKSGPNPRNFIRGYNDSSAYVADVIETSNRLGAIDLPRVVSVASVFPDAN